MKKTFKTLVCLTTCLIMAGCGKETEHASPSPIAPEVTATKPQRRNILRTVGQPGFVDAYEQSSIFPKITGFIEKWNVDIGDKVKKDQLLATLFVPELVEEYRLKQATVVLDKVMVEQAKKLVEVADGNLKAAVAKVAQNKALVGKFQAEVDRWQSEVRRLTDLVGQRVVDKQILDESTRQLRSNESARDAALAAVIAAQSDQIASDASLGKAKVDVMAAEARVRVAEADEKRLAALVGYIRLTSPFDGIVVIRNANTGDFVQGTTGDQTTRMMAPDLSSTKGAPIFAIARTDVVRIFVDVPEMDANYVNTNTDAEVRVQAFNDMRIVSKVTRTSWALNRQSRTLRAEIDLPNQDAKILPGMYAYGYIKIVRPNVMTIPISCVAKRGDQNVGFILSDNKIRQVNLKLGGTDGEWQEIVAIEKDGTWIPLEENLVFASGDTDEFVNGMTVKMKAATKE